MVRYRCPTMSFTDTPNTPAVIDPPEAGTPEVEQPQPQSARPDVRQRRRRPGVDLTKRREIELAKKREMIRKRTKVRVYSHVFVGNVKTTVTERDLFDTFSHCGKITQIQIRCSRGCVANLEEPADEDFCSERDRRYATIEFADHIAAVVKAVFLDGRILHGAPIVVCLSAADLPEVKDVVVRRLRMLRYKRDGRVYTPLSRIREQKTEVVRDPRADKNVFMGITFPKCVM